LASDHDAVIVAGVRTPFVEAGTLFGSVGAAELARVAVREAVERAEVDPETINEVVVGSAAGPADGGNLGRTASLLAKLPSHVPAFTVGRDGASGLEAIVEAAYRIRSGDADLVVAAAVESMSTLPWQWTDEAREIWARAARARGPVSRLAAFSALRPRHFRPVSPPVLVRRDPLTGLRMGEIAERLAREFDVPREDQDALALRSHRLAAAAWSEGRMAGEVASVPIPPDFEDAATRDDCIREDTSTEALSALRPALDGRFGTVTSGNAARVADGAVALVLASAGRARALGLRSLARVRSWGFAGCGRSRIGLGPVFAVPEALRRAGGLALERMDLVEFDEEFAAQVLACYRALESRLFCERYLGTGRVGAPDPGRVNVNGGAIAIGHPLGASGARLVLTLVREMVRRNASLGLATQSVGGGQGGAMVLERA
jgi:acetyl-CoA acetyltransferase family protein